MDFNRIVAIAGLALAGQEAHAYVDPGTASMAVQFMVGGVLAAVFVIKTYYFKLKAGVLKLFGMGPQDTVVESGGIETDASNTEAG